MTLREDSIDIRAFAPALVRDADGVWCAATDHAVSYPADGNARCAQIEDVSFWFQHRNRCITAAVRAQPPPGVIFDVGGGNGVVARALTDAGFAVALVEPGPAGVAAARARGVATLVRATLHTAGFLRGSLPAVGLFDVIEHVADAHGFLAAVRDVLAPNGKVYATVPAYGALWSHEDVEAGHQRRYTQGTLAAAFLAAGFDVTYLTSIFRPLPLPILLRRALPYRLGLTSGRADVATMAQEHGTARGVLTRLLDAALASEVDNVTRGRRMAFGGSCLIVARPAAAAS